MKKLIIMSVLIASSFIYKAADAQVNISVNFNSQPEWGPAGYDHVDYYYLPDLDVYYNVPNRTYTYMNGNRWETVNTLPQRYRNFDLYKSYKVVVNERSPWMHNSSYKNKYASYKGKSNQVTIRDRNKNGKVTRVIKTKATSGRAQQNNSRYTENSRVNDRQARKGRG